MHPTTQTLIIIGFPLLGIPMLVIGWSCLYYCLQAASNLKSNSEWPKYNGMAYGKLISIPRREFTELGLRYRQRAFVWAFMQAVWLVVVLSYWLFATWLTS